MAVYFLPKSRMKKFLGRTDLPQDMITVDVSGKGAGEWAVLAPTFAHGDIPVPGLAGVTSKTVEGIWEGLKRFENEGENLALLETDKPKKRKLTDAGGKFLGWAYGSETLKDEIEARQKIFIPAYTWMVKNSPEARAKFDALVDLARKNTLHVYDNIENSDSHDPRPYSYAALLTDMLKDARKAKAALV